MDSYLFLLPAIAGSQWCILSALPNVVQSTLSIEGRQDLNGRAVIITLASAIRSSRLLIVLLF